jgi:hypothetical protein
MHNQLVLESSRLEKLKLGVEMPKFEIYSLTCARIPSSGND